MPRSSHPRRPLAIVHRLALAGGVLAAMAASPAGAQTTLFYNGDPDYMNGWTSEQLPNWSVDVRIYDNFTVSGPTWTVTGLLGNLQARRVGTLGPSNVTWSTAYWEIRSGVSAGNGGTLLYSGTNATSLTLLPTSFWEANTYRTVVSGFTPFTLGPGTYWMTISPYPTGEVDPLSSIWTTDGTNGVHAQIDGQLYSDSPTFGTNFSPMHAWPNAAFSYGVLGTAVGTTIDTPPGTTTTPEPATLMLTALGLGGLAALARRQRRLLGTA
jgi:PEP-CTERM motif